jgi:hypothetical protein
MHQDILLQQFVTARHVANFCQFFAAAATARCSISATRTPAEVGEPADAFAARAAADPGEPIGASTSLPSQARRGATAPCQRARSNFQEDHFNPEGADFIPKTKTCTARCGQLCVFHRA